MKLTFDVPEEMAEKIAEDIKAALDEYKKKQIWPQEGDRYYYITSDGNIPFVVYNNSLLNEDRREFGNMFKTKEEAEFKLEKLKVMHELEELADDDQSWRNLAMCDLIESSRIKHYAIYYSHALGCIAIEEWKTSQHVPNTYYFKSYESAQAAIDKIGKDRLKKYYFCIPEE